MPFNFVLMSKVMIEGSIKRSSFANLLGISSDYLYRLEKGLKTDIKLSLLEKIAGYTGYSAGAFILGNDDSEEKICKPGKAASIVEIAGRSDRDRLARIASDEKVQTLEKLTAYLLSYNEFVMRTNAILHKGLPLAEKSKKLAGLARETAAAGAIRFDEIAKVLNVTDSKLSNWLESSKKTYTCRMDGNKTVEASSPDEAAMRFVCFDCENRDKGICGGFGRTYNPKNFDELIFLFEINGIRGRDDQAELLAESYDIEMPPHEISEMISRKKHGKHIPESIEDLRIRRRKK
jgi:transcriptional regulator with XRE-family HTH domain